jgi:poly(hydroxyalkanoate) depolymerase family esterase
MTRFILIFEKKTMKQLYFILFVFANQISVFSDNIGNMQKLILDTAIKTNLDFYLYSPPKCDGADKMPLVYVLHGCSQSVVAISKQSGWNDLAAKYGFYVLYVEQKRLNNMMGCFNWFSRHQATKDKGELGAMKMVLDDVLKQRNVEEERVFVYGLSAGAMMSVSLMVCYPETFKMGAILAGGPYMISNEKSLTPAALNRSSNYSDEELLLFVKDQNPDYQGAFPKLLVFHGLNDGVVNIKNADALIRQWSLLHARDSVIVEVQEGFENHPDISCVTYFNEKQSAFAIFYKVKNLGHKLMVYPGDGEKMGGQTGLFSIDKSFFSTYYIARDFGLIDDKSVDK